MGIAVVKRAKVMAGSAANVEQGLPIVLSDQLGNNSECYVMFGAVVSRIVVLGR
jgi:hypothetical protein